MLRVCVKLETVSSGKLKLKYEVNKKKTVLGMVSLFFSMLLTLSSVVRLRNSGKSIMVFQRESWKLRESKGTLAVSVQ